MSKPGNKKLLDKIVSLSIILLTLGGTAYLVDQANPTLPADLPENFVLYGETNGRDGMRPGNDIVLTSFDDNGEIKIWHEWPNTLKGAEGSPTYLRPDGTIIRGGSLETFEEAIYREFPPGAWDTLRILDEKGKVLWEYTDCEVGVQCLHHDIAVMPNGNILAARYQHVGEEELKEIGYDTTNLKAKATYVDSILELEPNLDDGTTQVVWQWNFLDHTVQDFDEEQFNFGNVAKQFTKIDVNAPAETDGAVANGTSHTHINSIDYNAELDQIVLSSASYNEIWVIDHSVSTDETEGKAGDLLFRWGNPISYDVNEERVFGRQHDALWVGTEQISVFNNGSFGVSRNPDVRSSVMTIDLERDNGDYVFDPNVGFLPTFVNVVTDYERDKQISGQFMSGAEIIEDYGVLISLSQKKRLLFVSPDDGTTKWNSKLPGRGGQFWKAQVFSSASDEIEALAKSGVLNSIDADCAIKEGERSDCLITH